MTGPGSTQSTVVIVEDDANTREALESLFAAADYGCSSFASGEDFLAEPLPPVPHCLLLDLQLGGQNGLEVQERLNARATFVPILFLSGEENITHAVTAMRNGALDFLQKPFNPEQLIARVERAMQASKEGYNRRQQHDHDAALLASLTQREHEILALLVEGNANKQIARTLDISVRTVESHRMHIMDKLEANTLADLVRAWLNCEPAAG